jgi:hypothetical protein
VALLDTVVGGVLAISGGVLGAYVAYVLARSSSRRQVTLHLLDRYNSPEFSAVRTETWRISKIIWPLDKSPSRKSIVEQFIPGSGVPEKQETHGPNGLTPHENLSILLHFYESLWECYAQKMANRKMLKTLFKSLYRSYLPFFDEFVAEYRRLNKDSNDAEHVWASALDSLSKHVFAP